MQNLLKKIWPFHKNPIVLMVIAAASLLPPATVTLVLEQRMQSDAAATHMASATLQARVIDLLELSRVVADYPQAVGTASEEVARGRLETALDRLQTLPADLAAHAARGRRIGNTVLVRIMERMQAETEADLLRLVGAIDRMIAPADSIAGTRTHAERVTALLLGRMLPELTLPQRVLDAGHDLAMQQQRKFLRLLIALTAVTVPGILALAVRTLLRADRRRARDMRDMQATLDKVAFTDPVTGLPNQRATQRFLDALPARQPVLIVVFEIIPAFGLPDGDEAQIAIGVAAAVGKRLRDLESDALHLGHAREGRFCLVLPAQEHDQISYSRHRDLESLADEPVQLNHRHVRLVFRAGVALRRSDRPAMAALENANIALDKARELRALQPMGYRPEFRRETIADQRIARELRVALMSGEVRPHFQPQIELSTGAVAGMEALARWHHPRRGLLPPGTFLPQAQRTGLDEPLGEVMLRLGLEALRAWDDRGLHVPLIGINTSASQLNNPRFYDFVRWELDRQQIPPERLAIEVLEDIYAASDDDPIARNLRKLSRLGVRIDMDDFGTGAASVMGMRRYHATRIKIDGSYVRDIEHAPTNQTLLSTMVQMALNLNIESLAEGVETAEERAWLARIGCNYIQGYHVARPMPLEATFDWLARYSAAPDNAVPARVSGKQG